jgi:hypothetical protein
MKPASLSSFGKPAVRQWIFFHVMQRDRDSGDSCIICMSATGDDATQRLSDHHTFPLRQLDGRIPTEPRLFLQTTAQ